MSPRYRILEDLGATTGSQLYRGQSGPDGVAVLLKVPHPGDIRPAQAARFEREYEAFRSLAMPGGIRPIALVNQDGQPVMVLEDVGGELLESVLNRQRLDVPACLRLGGQLAQIAGALHAAHIIHRDLRPANFMLDAQQQLRLLDLSLAAFAAQDGPVPANDLPGDWAYASPEQTGRMNRPLDDRTDFYSLGIMLYRMLTGQLPFAAGDPMEWTHCHIARQAAPPQQLVPEIPPVVSAIVLRLLAKHPEDRYQSAHGLKADLDRALAQWQAAGRVNAFPLGTEDVSEQFHIPHKLYGRDPEIATLLAAFKCMAATGGPALVAVSGEQGIGKSSLVNELQRPIMRARGYFIAGKFDQYQHDLPYATITQAFRTLVQQLLAESEARIAGWRQKIQAALGIHGQLIVDVLPQVELIIGKQAPVPALGPSEAQRRFRMVFRQFATVFARRDHPLVLFLDDCQWIDGPSLALIEHLLTHPDTRHLMLICAYSDYEVTAHQLKASIEAIRAAGAAVIGIRLAPLSVEPLNRLVADTLHTPPAACVPLTRLVWQRTEGNPFFFTQFLQALHQEGLLRRDAQHRRWHWDLAHIEAKDFADNVAGLMVGKLRQLPLPTQEALQLAACLGNTFELRHLALASGRADLEQALAPALRESVIMRTNGSAKFLHHRIQQAAYSLIPQQRRAEVHLCIGRMLLAHLTADEISAHLFDVANQLNRGAALLAGRDEKAQVAELDLRAGRKAKASTEYGSACAYLAAGMALLDDSDWDRRYRLMFALWRERVECEFLRSNFDEAEQFIAILLQRGASRIDLATVYHQKALLHILKSEYPKAVDDILTCLKLFGIDIPAHPSWEQVQAEYETVWRNLDGRPIESLIELPLMTDPELQSAMEVLSALFGSAYVTDNGLFCLHLCRMVNLSMRHGTSGASAPAFGWLGFILGPVFRRYREGDQFARLACNLVDKHGFVAYRAKVQDAAGNTAFWTQPMGTAIELVRASHRTALETGDLTSACYTMLHIITLLLLRNDPLEAVWRESEIALNFLRKSKFRDIDTTIVPEQRFIAAMQGRTASISTLNDGQFDEAAFEAQLTDDGTTPMACWYWILKLQARFLAGEYAEALAAADQAKALLWAAVGQIRGLNYYYYGALTVAALFENAAADQQTEWRALLAAHREQLGEWAEHCAPTFRDKHALISAEIARLDGRDADAMRLYEVAIQSAHQHGFVLNEAIAYERGAAFYRTRGVDTIADMYLREARRCYTLWGADGKVRQLDERNLPLRAAPVFLPAIGLSNVAQLDTLSVTKASQAISGQIVLDELVHTLMRIVLENAGAQAGALLLYRNDSLLLAADARVEQQTVHVQLHRDPISPELRLPAAILNYVRRSREPVLLADVAQPNHFAGDPYFAHRRPKSVLCLPILRQAELIGVLYLENSLVTHAFTPNRVAVLDLLASQAAISLENALLYADLREREARIRRLVESNVIGIFFWDLQGGISEANDAFLQMIGYTLDELLSGAIQWTELTPPELRATDARKTIEVRTTGTCAPYEKAFIRKDGSRVPVMLGAALFEGQESGVAFVLDLTERERAEEALRKSEEHWRAVFEHNPTMYFILNEDGTIAAVNPVGAQQLGYTVDELVDTPVLDIFHEDDRQFVKNSVFVCLEQPNQTKSWEVRKIRKNGTMLWVRETVKAMPRANNRSIVLVVCEDITERKETEDKLRRNEAFLAEGQRISHTGSWGWHIQSGKLVWSEEHYRIFGFEPEEAAPTFQLFLERLYGEDRPIVEQLLDDAIRTKSGFDCEFRITLPDGFIKYLQGIGRPIVKPSGEVEEFIGTTMDITERKRAEEALRAAHEELERRVLERTSELQQSNRQLASEVGERQRAEAVLAQRSQELARSNAQLEQMAYVASHDLQEPLRMVASYMQILEEKYQDRLDADAHEFIRFAVDGATRMQALIDDLLTYSRVGSKMKPLQPVDCTAVVATALSALGMAVEESGAQVHYGALPEVMGDAAQLTQVFQNLIANAIKFRGNEPPEIHIDATPDDGFWRFAVQDNGIGIAPDYFERIFVMFQRLHSRSLYPGTGMGLAICKKIVERHGGRIWVESAPRQGTTFLFTLPQKSGENHE